MFDNVIGQDNLKKFFTHEINNGTLSYGYIIEAPKYMGKSFILNAIASEITLPAYITVVTPTDDRKNIHVDDIRRVRDEAYTLAFNSSVKVFIIEDGDILGIPAQNAFLKILEEPPQACVFLIGSRDSNNLLTTIRSRCTTLRLSSYSDTDIKIYLDTLNIAYDSKILRLCDGAINKCVYLNSVEFKEVQELSERILINILDLHPSRVFAIYKHIQKLKDYVEDVFNIFLLWYRDILIYQLSKDTNLIESNLVDSIVSLSSRYTKDQVEVIIEQIYKAKNKLNYNCSLEMTINSLLMYMRGVV